MNGVSFIKIPVFPGHIDPPYDAAIKNRDDLEKWLKNKPDPFLKSRLDDLKAALKISNGEVAVIGGVIGPLTLAILTLGFEGMLMKLMDEPDMVEEIFKTSCDYYKVAANKMIDAGADAIFVCEDLGFNDGIFAPPGIYRKHLFPYLSSLIDEIKGRNVPVLLHSCGNVNEILDDLADLVFQRFIPSREKPAWILEESGKDTGANCA